MGSLSALGYPGPANSELFFRTPLDGPRDLPELVAGDVFQIANPSETP